MFAPVNLHISIKLIIAELIFLFGCPRRKWFILRFVGAIGLCLLMSYFFPMPSFLRREPLYMFFRMIVLIVYTICAMAFCFKLKFVPLVSSCVAGYAVQHIAHQIGEIVSNSFDKVLVSFSFQGYLIFAIVCLVMFLVFGIPSAKRKSYQNSNIKLLLVDIVIVGICIGLTRFSDGAYSLGNCIYAIVCCVLALFIQFNLYYMFALVNENKAIKIIREEEKKQYEISKSTIELINIKYHDLKRRLSSIGELTQEEMQSIRDTLQLWDTQFKTGNEVLDVILTENSLRHRQDDVEITFMGNGETLSFMNVADIYSLFGNAIENAIEAVLKIENSEKKVIGMSIESKGDLIFINVTNYFDGQIEIRDGLPVSSKEGEDGFHGFGLKSIKLIAEKYHGEMKIAIKDDQFHLNVWLMR